MKKKYIVFDFDGTLLDTNQVIIDSWQEVYKHYTGTTGDEAEILHTFGETIVDSMKSLFPDVDQEEAKKIYRGYQAKHANLSIELFPGMKELIIELKERGYSLSIVTSRMKNTTFEYLDKFDIEDFFDVIITCDDTDAHKPDPRPLLIALDKLGASKEDSIMLGDTRFDIGCCRNAGVDSVLVEWSHAIDENEIKNGYMPDYRIAEPRELFDLI